MNETRLDRKTKSITIKGIVRAFLVVTLGLIAVYLLLWLFHAYRMSWTLEDLDGDGLALIDDQDPDGDGIPIGQDRDGNNNGIENEKEAVAFARKMINIPYDPFKGAFNDFWGRIGFVVCIDVPVRSYLLAGVSMPALLKSSALANPEWFKIEKNNSPENKFFYRRVRNYYQLFLHHPDLETDKTPHPGDWAFYGLYHIALVIEVNQDGAYKVIEASPLKFRVAKSGGEYMRDTWGPPDFFGRIKYQNPAAHR